MKEKVVKFKGANDAKMFIARADRCDFDIDIHYNHITLDGKSIMALLSLDFSNPIIVKYAGENLEFESLLEKLAVNY